MPAADCGSGPWSQGESRRQRREPPSPQHLLDSPPSRLPPMCRCSKGYAPQAPAGSGQAVCFAGEYTGLFNVRGSSAALPRGAGPPGQAVWEDAGREKQPNEECFAERDRKPACSPMCLRAAYSVLSRGGQAACVARPGGRLWVGEGGRAVCGLVPSLPSCFSCQQPLVTFILSGG